jgi:hypothetical protein
LLALSGVANAQPQPADAERLFREGRTLMEAGDYVHACPKFADSEKLDPAPGTLLSLADCEERGKKLVSAREHYQLAGSGFPKKDPRRAFAAGRAQALDKRIAHLTYRLPENAPPDTTVRVGDAIVSRSELGTSTATDPGALKIVVSAPGRVDAPSTLTIADGETREVFLEVGAPEAVAPPPSTGAEGVVVVRPDKPRTDIRRTASYALLGAGAASLVVGSVSGILAIGKASTVKDHCTGDYVCDQEGIDAASSGRFLSPLSTVTLIAGAALVGVGAYLYFVSAKGKKAEAGAASVAIIPLVSPDTAGLRLWKEF